MKKYFISFLFIIFAATGGIVLSDKISAQDADTIGIQYPVEELGGCKDKEDCKTYCDNQENLKVCVDFAEKNNLMSEEEIKIAKNFIAAGSKGPGGCTSKDSCEQYCNDMSRIDECVSFAEKNNLMSPAELEEVKKVQSVIARGVKPPPCGNKKACDVYCEELEHMEECITFGAEAGFIQGKELEDAQKMLQAIKRGVKPPPCKGKEACDEYCSAPENMEVCMNFAIEAGFMSEQEKADCQKMLQAIKKGVKPPNCKGKEECDVYCSQDENFEECTNFAEAAGFMTAEEAAMARKTGGKGPGGCKGKEECEAFCNNLDNQETCFNFAKDNGLIPEEDLKQMEQGKAQMKNALETAPPEVIDCLTSLLGAETVEKLKAGTGMPGREIGDKMGECFSKSPNGGEPFGPGGCKGQEECQVYCQEHPDECQNIQQGPQAGPGECKTPEECTIYCSDPAHESECQSIKGPQPIDNSVKQTGPGGCQSPEECEAYCNAHREECGAPSGGQQEPQGDQQYQQPPQPGEFPTQPGQYIPQESIQPSPSTAPGEGGAIPPGDFVPPVEQQPPVQQQPPAGENVPMSPQPPVEQQPPVENLPPPPSSFLDPNSLLGSTIQSFIKFFTR